MTKYEATKFKYLRYALAILLIVCLGGAIVLGVGFGVYGKDTSSWFKPKQNNAAQDIEQSEKQEEPVVIESQEENGLKLSSSVATTSDDGTVTKVLTATVEPDTAATVGYLWTVEFKNASSEWAKEKNVEDYVTVTQDSSDELKATVTCKAAFSEQIVVKIKSKYTSAYASCTVDYFKRVTSLELTVKIKDRDNSVREYAKLTPGQTYPDLFFVGTNDGHSAQPPLYKFELTVNYSDGTISGDIEVRSYQSGAGISNCDLLEGNATDGYVLFDEALHGSSGNEIGNISLRVIYDNQKIAEWTSIRVIESAQSIALDITQIVF